MMRYQLRAYASVADGKAARATPSDKCETGSITTAKHYARGMSEDYGACVIADAGSGARVWFENGKECP